MSRTASPFSVIGAWMNFRTPLKPQLTKNKSGQMSVLSLSGGSSQVKNERAVPTPESSTIFQSLANHPNPSSSAPLGSAADTPPQSSSTNSKPSPSASSHSIHKAQENEWTEITQNAPAPSPDVAPLPGPTPPRPMTGVTNSTPLKAPVLSPSPSFASLSDGGRAPEKKKLRGAPSRQFAVVAELQVQEKEIARLREQLSETDEKWRSLSEQNRLLEEEKRRQEIELKLSGENVLKLEVAKAELVRDLDTANEKIALSFDDAQRVQGKHAGEIKHLESALRHLEDEKSELILRLDAAQAQLASSSKDILSLEGENRRCTEEIAELKKAFVSVEEERSTLSSRFESLRTQFATVREEKGALAEQVKTMEDMRKTLEALEEEKAEAALRISSMDMRLTSVMKENQTLLEDKRRQTNEMESLGKTLRVVKGEKAELLTRVDSADARILSLSKQNRDLDASYRHQRSEQHQLEKNVQALEEGKKELAGRIAEMEGQITSATERNQHLEETNQQQAGEISKMREAIQAAEEIQRFASEQLKKAEQKNQENEEVVLRIKDEVEGKDSRLQEVQALAGQANTRAESLQEEVNTLIQLNGELQQKLQHHSTAQTTETETRTKEILALKGELLESKQQERVLHRQLEALERRNRMLDDQFHRLSYELQMTRALPRRANNVPPSLAEFPGGIVGMVDTLNTEIFQTSAFMTDTLKFSAKSTNNRPREMRNAIERSAQTIGLPMLYVLRSILAKGEPELDPLPIQIALQACLASCCSRIIKSWYPGHWEYADFIATIYTRLQGSVGQQIASRWRTLTQAQLKYPPDKSVENQMKVFLADNLADALTVAGWDEAEPKRQKIMDGFDEKITTLVKLALRLNSSLGDDWAITFVNADEPFDARRMDDAYQDGKRVPRKDDAVVCTTDLGLNIISDNNRMVFKPKVVFKSMF